MKIVLFAHPVFLGHQSMPRFAHLLADGMSKRGHKVEIWLPEAQIFRLPVPKVLKKWFGYIDQYLIFPAVIRKRIKSCTPDTLFVFTDQALGPWVPLVVNRPHVIHCHDFLAQRSALGEISENRVGWSGRQYQRLIFRGYSKGKHFISVSKKTREDLHRFLPSIPLSSEVVYNGMNQAFIPGDYREVRARLGKEIKLNLMLGYLLHVGGNHFYKNRLGIIQIYDAWRSISEQKLPLLMIGEAPTQSLLEAQAKSPFKVDIHFLPNMPDEIVRLAYAGASVFLFPSLAEGFGWPIAEAMASGCPVITTNEPPMTEVGGDVAFYISRRPSEQFQAEVWATEGAKAVQKVLGLNSREREAVIKAGINNAGRFSPEVALQQLENIYQKVIKIIIKYK